MIWGAEFVRCVGIQIAAKHDLRRFCLSETYRSKKVNSLHPFSFIYGSKLGLIRWIINEEIPVFQTGNRKPAINGDFVTNLRVKGNLEIV